MNQRNVSKLLWVVVAVLVVGGGIAIFMLMHKVDNLQTQNDTLSGDNDSLLRQITQLKASPTPLPTPDNSAATPIPTPTATPKTSTTPIPSPTP